MLIGNVKGQGNDTFTTGGFDSSGANLLVMVTHSDHATITPSDSNGNTWLQAVQDATVKVCTIFYSYYKGSIGTPIATGVGHTFTLTGTDHFGTIQVYAFDSIVTASTPLDQTNHNISFGSTTGSPGSVTPAQDGELIVSGDCHDTSSTATINSSFTSPAGAGTGYGDPQALGVALGGHSAYLFQGTAGAVNPTWTVGSGANHYMTIATFKTVPAPTVTVLSQRSKQAYPFTTSNLRPAPFRPGIAR